MRRTLVTLAPPSALAIGTFGSGFVADPAGAVQNHVVAMAHTWHGKVARLNETMGTTESFNVAVGAKTYVVHYDAMTHWAMGTMKNIKV